MQKLSLTMTGLKREKDKLAVYSKFLPLLELKKQQLRSAFYSLCHELKQLEQDLASATEKLQSCAYLSRYIKLDDFLESVQLTKRTVNYCGLNVEKIDSIDYPLKDYSVESTPPWLEMFLHRVVEARTNTVKQKFLSAEKEIIEKELSHLSQRINLFEKVLIPKAQKNIHKIKIYLNDQQTAAVVRNKKCKELSQRRRV